jgi:hypothetical protein
MAVGSAALAVAVGFPAAAGANKAKAKTPTGLACLKGKWILNGIVSSPPGIFGLGGTVLTVTLEHGGRDGIADADYDRSSPIRFVADSSADLQVRGSTFGRFYYEGHGRYRFTAGVSSEQVSVLFGGRKVAGPLEVKHGTGYADLAGAATKLTSEITVPTKTGTAKVKATYRRSR